MILVVSTWRTWATSNSRQGNTNGHMNQDIDKLVGDEQRSLAELRHHYEVEKAIASRLKQASRKERKAIYSTMYEELFKQVPDHSRLNIREAPELTEQRNRRRMRLVEKFIHRDSVFLEFAPGDCRFAMALCDRVKSVHGVDISDQSGSIDKIPNNFHLTLYDGYNLDLPDESMDVVFSDQLLEHLHPDDTEHHFKLVRRILKPNGVYVFRTPHRFSGPWDVSRYFSDEPEGFHLKEWTYREMEVVLGQANYSSWQGYRYAKGTPRRVPFVLLTAAEALLSRLPKKWMRRFSRRVHSGNITIAAFK